MPPAAREIWGYNYDHMSTAVTTDVSILSMHTLLNPYPCLPLSATTYFLKVGDTKGLRCHPCSRGFRVMLEVGAPWLLEVILKPRCCGSSASLWAVSISLVVIPLWKPKNRLMARYTMESWSTPQNVNPHLTMTRSNYSSYASLRLLNSSLILLFFCTAPLILFLKLWRAAAQESLFMNLECPYGADVAKECCLRMILVKASKLTHKHKHTCGCLVCAAIDCVEKHHETSKRLCWRWAFS